MKKQTLLKNFLKIVSEKNRINGRRVLDNELVSNMDLEETTNYVGIKASVISENFFNEYISKLNIDIIENIIISLSCSCEDYEKNKLKKHNYICKHLVATFYKFYITLEDKDLQVNTVANTNNDIIDMLVPDMKGKEELKIDVYLHKQSWNNKLLAEFKIGSARMQSNKLYVLKDISQFMISFYNNISVQYGKDFIFNSKSFNISYKNMKIIEFIEIIEEMQGKALIKGKDKLINGKYVTIPKFLTKEFLTRIKEHRVYLSDGFFHRPVETEIIIGNPNIKLDLEKTNESFNLSITEGLPELFNDNYSILLYGSDIYLTDYEYSYNLKPFYNLFSSEKKVFLPISDKNKIYSKLIPRLHNLSNHVNLSNNISDDIVLSPVKFKFYFNKENNNITLILKVSYGIYEFNIFYGFEDKYIYRDSSKEKEVLSLLRSLGFERSNDKFFLIMGDDYIFRFFKLEIKKLQEIGEVYYSENFKVIKSLSKSSIRGDIKPGNTNYLEFTFKLGNIPSSETRDILRAFKNNLKYYKLSSGEYLDLEELELANMLKILDTLSIDENIENNNIIFNKNKSLYLSSLMEENDVRFIKGKKQLSEIKTKINNINKIKISTIENLNATLREYQKYGLNWLNTLDYLDFGGILADEMGLGKTLQIISFLANKKRRGALIIAPTSLIYNWQKEFERFVPSLSVKVINGSKDQRNLMLKEIKENDIIITTYNLLKRDLDLYKDKTFNYCILDEAQYIKNPSSINAKAVKEIKALNRFALTGTPIENSLMELWSIFDFIMPGFLYDEKRFSVRYHKKLNESKEVLGEVQKLITPFILRRYKKDVLKELPEKIEKQLFISLPIEQQKVYATYANYAKDIISKKVKDAEFNTSKIEILSYITRLRQLCIDPTIVMDDYTSENGKIEALIEILNNSIEEGHKILIFSQFTSVLKNLISRLTNEDISHYYLDGSIPSEKRLAMVQNFNNDDTSVFLISLKAGGTGLNLTSADIVIHLDPWWNPAVEDQASDRAHRLGQKNVVEVIKLIAKDTIEEKVMQLQNKKRTLTSSLINSDDESFKDISSLSEEDIIELFT